MEKKGGVRKVTRIGAVLACLTVAGCASTPPWVGGIERSDYYHQGVGQGKTEFEAEKRSLIELCASIHERDVKQVETDFRREHGELGKGIIEEDFRQWVEVYIEGAVPAEARVVDRWSTEDERWAYAIVERPRMDKKIARLFKERMQGLHTHAFVPGWAQFQQGRNRAGWTFMTGVGFGLITGVSGSILSADKVSRHNRETTRAMREYYDDQANRYFWFSVAGYTLAGLSYAANVIDGLTVTVAPYKVLTSTHSNGLEVAVAF